MALSKEEIAVQEFQGWLERIKQPDEDRLYEMQVHINILCSSP